MRRKLFILMVVLVSGVLGVMAQTSQRIAVPTSVDKWITTTFAKGKTPPIFRRRLPERICSKMRIYLI